MQLSYSDIQRIKEVVNRFNVCDGEITHVILVDSGRINSTFKIVITSEDDTTSYMLQKLNQGVFKDVKAVMDNAIIVTDHLRSKGLESLEYVYTKDGEPILWQGNDAYRMTKFIHAEVFQTVGRPKDMYMLGQAVGQFALGLNDLDATKVVDTIPRFHDTQNRYELLLESAIKNARVGGVRLFKSNDELDYVIAHKEEVERLVSALARNEIPLRVTHNDTKLNNVLFDRKNNTPRCMIDLDTVMQGTILYDLADAIRYGANTASEEETDYSKVSVNLELIKAFLEGFKATAPDLLTEKEKELLPIAIILMPLELGIRFLTDYYDGDKYFSVSPGNEDHNLIRARVQFGLTKDIEAQMEEIKKIVAETLN